MIQPTRQYVRQRVAQSIAAGQTNDDAFRLAGFGSVRHAIEIATIHSTLHHGLALKPDDIATLCKIFPAVPRKVIEQKAAELNAAPSSPQAKARDFLRQCVGERDLGRAERTLTALTFDLNNLRHNDKRADEDNRTQQAIAARAARESDHSRRERLDRESRRAFIESLVTHGMPQFKEPDARTHADRMEASAHILHGSKPASVRDVVSSAYDAHAALEFGKEQGTFSESQGIPSEHGPIGGDSPAGEAAFDPANLEGQ